MADQQGTTNLIEYGGGEGLLERLPKGHLIHPLVSEHVQIESSPIQIKIDDIKSTKEILKNLGLVECLYYKKFRQHWTLGKTAIELDKLRHIYFVEIEAPKKEINELAKILGLDWKQSNTKNYLEILKELKL